MAPTPVLPLARLRRLGLDDLGEVALTGWWDELSDEDRIREADALAISADGDLANYVEAIKWLRSPAATTTSVLVWVEGAAHPADAALLARAVEQTRDKPRVGLLSALADRLRG